MKISNRFSVMYLTFSCDLSMYLDSLGLSGNQMPVASKIQNLALASSLEVYLSSGFFGAPIAREPLVVM